MFCRSGDVTSVEDPLETFVECTKSALVVSEVFCLPKDYRKDVPPPSKMLSSSAIDKSRLKYIKAIFNTTILFAVEGDMPIKVYFKLPVSEISKIDDQRSVSVNVMHKLIYLNQYNLMNIPITSTLTPGILKMEWRSHYLSVDLNQKGPKPCYASWETNLINFSANKLAMDVQIKMAGASDDFEFVCWLVKGWTQRSRWYGRALLDTRHHYSRSGQLLQTRNSQPSGSPWSQKQPPVVLQSKVNEYSLHVCQKDLWWHFLWQKVFHWFCFTFKEWYDDGMQRDEISSVSIRRTRLLSEAHKL